MPVHDGTIDSTTLIVTEHKFLFRFFSLDPSFSPSDQSGIDCAIDQIRSDQIRSYHIMPPQQLHFELPLQSAN